MVGNLRYTEILKAEPVICTQLCYVCVMTSRKKKIESMKFWVKTVSNVIFKIQRKMNGDLRIME